MKDTEGKDFVTDDNTGGHFVIECQECGHVCSSGHCDGGEPIADMGDYGDCLCPKCGAVDPDDCENPNKVWNVQQAKINDLQNKLNEATTEIDRLRKETNIGDPLGDIYITVSEHDQTDGLKSRGAIAMETYTGKANLVNAVDHANRLNGRYGEVTICKLLPVGSLEFCHHVVNSPFLDDDALCKHVPSVFDRSQMEDHPRFDPFIRAFWRRVYPYLNDYERELPEQMPTPLKCSMATALMAFDMEARK